MRRPNLFQRTLRHGAFVSGVQVVDQATVVQG
jgi:hypothetical protein